MNACCSFSEKQTSSKGSVPPTTMLGRNLSMLTGNDNSLFSASNDASVVIWYEEIAAYPVYKKENKFNEAISLKYQNLDLCKSTREGSRNWVVCTP